MAARRQPPESAEREPEEHSAVFMCTLIVLHRCVPGRPLVVAANRDEFFARPAEDLAIRDSATGPILSPLDLEAGGTWVGLSQRGVFAGLTNLRPASSEDAQADSRTLKSRGGVVMAALEAASAAEAKQKFSELEEGAYNPFQLLVADCEDAFLVVYRDRARIVELEPGPHIVGNVEDERISEALALASSSFDPFVEPSLGDIQKFPGFEGIDGLNGSVDSEEPRAIKLTRIRQRVEKLVTDPGIDLFEGLARVCREHVETNEAGESIASPFEATCVHLADRYGTRSSLLLELSEDPGSSRLWATDGPPCERPFENRSSLLKDLGVRLKAVGGDRNDARRDR